MKTHKHAPYYWAIILIISLMYTGCGSTYTYQDRLEMKIGIMEAQAHEQARKYIEEQDKRDKEQAGLIVVDAATFYGWNPQRRLDYAMGMESAGIKLEYYQKINQQQDSLFVKQQSTISSNPEPLK